MFKGSIVCLTIGFFLIQVTQICARYIEKSKEKVIALHGNPLNPGSQSVLLRNRRADNSERSWISVRPPEPTRSPYLSTVLRLQIQTAGSTVRDRFPNGITPSGFSGAAHGSGDPAGSDPESYGGLGGPGGSGGLYHHHHGNDFSIGGSVGIHHGNEHNYPHGHQNGHNSMHSHNHYHNHNHNQNQNQFGQPYDRLVERKSDLGSATSTTGPNSNSNSHTTVTVPSQTSQAAMTIASHPTSATATVSTSGTHTTHATISTHNIHATHTTQANLGRSMINATDSASKATSH